MTDIALLKAERGVLIGSTGTGKSTLATDLLYRFLVTYPQARLLILDSKPRYRATWNASGVKMLYRGWDKGDTLPGSIGFSTERLSLSPLFTRSRVLIFQSMTPSGQATPAYQERAALYANELFRYSNSRRPTLLYADELYDEMKGASTWTDERILRAFRAGRERNMAVLVGAQRPAFIPIPALSEATNYYAFWLKKPEDWKKMIEYSGSNRPMPGEFEFVFTRWKGAKKVVDTVARLQV